MIKLYEYLILASMNVKFDRLFPRGEIDNDIILNKSVIAKRKQTLIKALTPCFA